jgi:hypothetical protein
VWIPPTDSQPVGGECNASTAMTQCLSKAPLETGCRALQGNTHNGVVKTRGRSYSVLIDNRHCNPRTQD